MTKFGHRGFASILRLVLDKPMDHAEVASEIGFGVEYVRNLMRGMHALGLVHAGSWRRNARGFARPVYAFGDKPDAPAPAANNGVNHPGVTRPKRIYSEVVAFATIVRALQEPVSAHGVIAASGVNEATAYRLLVHMHGLRLIHVSEWERRIGIGGTPQKLYLLAPDKPDAPRPAREDHRAAVRRYGKKRRARNRQIRMLHALAANASDFIQQLQA